MDRIPVECALHGIHERERIDTMDTFLRILYIADWIIFCAMIVAVIFLIAKVQTLKKRVEHMDMRYPIFPRRCTSFEVECGGNFYEFYIDEISISSCREVYRLKNVVRYSHQKDEDEC